MKSDDAQGPEANTNVAMPPTGGHVSNAQGRLGVELRRHRLRRGLSQAKLVTLLGLSARSNLSDYERGRRLAPLDILAAAERALRLPPRTLQTWHEAAVEEHAEAWYTTTLGHVSSVLDPPEPPMPDGETATPR